MDLLHSSRALYQLSYWNLVTGIKFENHAPDLAPVLVQIFVFFYGEQLQSSSDIHKEAFILNWSASSNYFSIITVMGVFGNVAAEPLPVSTSHPVAILMAIKPLWDDRTTKQTDWFWSSLGRSVGSSSSGRPSLQESRVRIRFLLKWERSHKENIRKAKA